jgi:hypothetical protein
MTVDKVPGARIAAWRAPRAVNVVPLVATVAASPEGPFGQLDRSREAVLGRGQVGSLGRTSVQDVEQGVDARGEDVIDVSFDAHRYHVGAR